MTREEVITMMKYFQSAYKGFYEGANTANVLAVWLDAFKDVDGEYALIAAKNYVKSNDYPPTVAGVMKQIDLIKSENDTDLWASLHKAISNGVYNSEAEFKKLPPECKSFIGSPSALRDLAQTDTGTINTVVKGQFLKTITKIKEHQSVQNGLPFEVKAAIAESKRRLLEENL